MLTLKPRVEKYNFSAHSGDNELKKLVRDSCSKGTQRVFVVHGDNTELFVKWISEEIGVEAYSPAKGGSLSFNVKGKD
jgi:putative mRNA 3-end processing factor